MIQVNSVQNFNQNGNMQSSNKLGFGIVERTLVGIKPDAYHRGAAKRLREELPRATDLKVLQVLVGIQPRETMARHYAEHAHKPFFQEWLDDLAKGPFTAIVLEGEDAIAKGRAFVEKMRSMYKTGKRKNLIHASDSPDAARAEIENFFPNLFA